MKRRPIPTNFKNKALKFKEKRQAQEIKHGSTREGKDSKATKDLKDGIVESFKTCSIRALE